MSNGPLATPNTSRLPGVLARREDFVASKLHAVCDGQGRSVVLLLSENQMSDNKSAALILPSLPAPGALLGNRGYDSNG